MSDVEEAMRGYPKVNFRYLIVPKEPLPSNYIPLKFDPEAIDEMIETGWQDAADAIKLGEGTTFGLASMVATEMMFEPESMEHLHEKVIKAKTALGIE